MTQTTLHYFVLVCLCCLSKAENRVNGTLPTWWASSWSSNAGSVHVPDASSDYRSIMRSAKVMDAAPQEVEISPSANLHHMHWRKTPPSSMLQADGNFVPWNRWDNVEAGVQTIRRPSHTTSLPIQPETFKWLLAYRARNGSMDSVVNVTSIFDSSAPVINQTVITLVVLTSIVSCVALLSSLFMLVKPSVDVPVTEVEAPTQGMVVSLVQILGITSVNFAYGVSVCTMGVFLLPKEAQTMFPNHPCLALGAFEACWSFSMLVGPVAGRISDSLKHPMGRRRPMVHISTHLVAIATAAMWVASLYNLRYVFVVLIPIQQMMWNAVSASQTALLADLVDPSRKDVASAIQVAGALAGAIVSIAAFQGFAIDSMDYRWNYPFMIIGVWLVLPLMHMAAPEQASERLSLPAPLDWRQPRAALGSIFYLGDDRSPDFVLITKERAVYYAGVASKAFVFFWIKDGIGISDDAEQAIVLGEIALMSSIAATSAGLATSLIFSMTRIRPQNVACFGGLLMAFSCQFWGVSYLKTVSMRKLLMLIQVGGYGAGQGCYLAADLALAIGTMPDPNEASRYMGLWGLSAFLGGSLGSLGTSALMEIFGKFVPHHLGIQTEEGSYHIWGYMSLLIASFIADVYVGVICYIVRTRDEYNKTSTSTWRAESPVHSP